MTDERPIPEAPVPPQSPVSAQAPAPATSSVPAPAPLPPALEVGPSIADLAKSVRRHRIWLTVLTVLMILPLLLSCFGLSAIPIALEGLAGGMMSIDDEQLERSRDQVEDAYGDRIKELDIRVVTTVYEDGLPFSFLPNGMDEESLYIECELKDSGVVVADVISMFYGPENLAGSGIIPTKGDLSSRMSEEQLDAVLEAYAAETDSPLGAVRRYSDADEMYGDGSPVPEEVKIGKKAYPSSELWKLTEGLIVEGDTVNGDDESFYTRRAHVFHENPETGEFLYLGTESSDIW